MKIITQTITVLFLFLSAASHSQNARPIAELLEELSQNHLGSVTDVFTLDEIQIIKEHFAETNFPTATESALLEERFASTESVNIPFQAVDIDPSNFTNVQILRNSPISAFPGAGGYIRGSTGPGGGPPRIIVVDNDGHLWVRDPGENPVSITDMGELTGIPAGHSITGIEVLTSKDAPIYGMSTDGTNSLLVRIMPDNLTVTPVGGNSGLKLAIGLGRDVNNSLYAIDIDTDMLYIMDQITGAGTPVGALGTNADFGQGLFFDEGSSQLISIAYNGIIGDSEIRIVSTETGVSISFGTIQPGTVQQFGWGASYDRDSLGVIESEINGFSLYPNPAQNTISIKAATNIETIEIYSVLGTLVKNQTIGRKNIQLDISELYSGAYILRVTTAKQSGSYKLIKK